MKTAAVEKTTYSNPLFDQTFHAMKQTSEMETKMLLHALVDSFKNGEMSWEKNLTHTLNRAIDKIDQALSQQLSRIMHQPSFLKLEGSWRGLSHLASNISSTAQLKIKMLSLSKNELYKDLDKAVEFDQSQIFKKTYEEEFGTPGGEPYGVLIGDYEFNNSHKDIEILRKISNVSAAAFCPFISAAGASFFGLTDWTELNKPRDLEKIFSSAEYAAWRGFRETEEARFTALTLPRVLSRLPYGNATNAVEAFHFEENNDAPEALAHDQHCWMNAAYTMGVQIANAFTEYGWCTAIRGVESGGKVANLPLYTVMTEDGDIDAHCPTEIGITDRREAELSRLGFLPLCHYKNTNYAIFFGAETTQKAPEYDIASATENAKISARLPYIMATGRFAHYLKIMARDKIGSFMEATEVEEWLNRWILQYVNANAASKQELKAKYPLAEAKIQVTSLPGSPGSYNAVAWLRPWLQMEELSTSLRLVAKIPELHHS